MDVGDKIRYTVDNLGVTIAPGTRPSSTVEANSGDVGELVEQNELAGESWWQTRVIIDGDTYYCPVHESMFELVVEP